MDKNKVIESAAKLIAKGQFEKAVKEYQRILDEDPDDVRVLQKLAELYQKMNRKEEAADCFEKVAKTYAAQGFYLKAVALYKQVLKVVERIEVNVKLAELYQQLGLVGDATKEWQNVAAFHEKKGDVKQSLDVLKKLVDLDGDNVAARIRLGEAYARQEQNAQATQELRRAAHYLKRNGRTDDYLRVAERISHLDPSDVQLARDLAEIYLGKADSKRALSKLQICFKANPRDIGTLQLLARAFQDLGQVSKTVSVLKELARVYVDGNLPEDARRAYRQALELAPEDSETRQALRALEPPDAMKTPSSPGIPRVPGQSGPGIPRSTGSSGPGIPRSATSSSPGIPRAATTSSPGMPAAATSSSPGMPRAATQSSPGLSGGQPPPPPPGAMGLATPPVVPKAPPPPPGDLTPMPMESATLEAAAALAGMPLSGGTPVPIAQGPSAPRARPAEPTPATPASVSKLLKETDVYLKYRLFEKAYEHVGKILALDPENAEAHEKSKSVALATGRTAEAIASLVELIRLYTGKDEERASASRDELRTMQPDHPALSGADDDTSVEAELNDLAEEASGEILAESSQPVTGPAQADEAEIEAEEVAVDVAEPAAQRVAQVAQTVAQPPPSPGARAEADAGGEADAAPPAADDAFASDLAEADFYLQQGLADDARAILEGILLAEPHHAEAARRLEEINERISGPGGPEITLLDARPVGGPPPPATGPGDDLAAELARELAEEAESGAAGLHKPDGSALDVLDPFQVPAAEVASAFRAKVQEVIRPEDVQTHYDLGIAYKEMGLVEEAIGEFELALDHGEGAQLVDCYTMLGQCALEKGEGEQAIAHYQSALAEPACSAGARLALSFDIGEALESLGRPGEALEAYSAVQKMDPRYRDVGARVGRLEHEVTGNRKAAGRAAQPLVKKPQNGEHIVSSPVPTGPTEAQPQAEPGPADGRRNRKIGFV